MWDKLIKLFKMGRIDTQQRECASNQDIMEEIDAMKKHFRKQGIFLDLFRKEILERLEEKRVKEVGHFFEFAEAFFYHERSLRELPDISSSQEEALAIVWEKLESLLFSMSIEVIRKADVDFDPRLYEAIEKLGEGNGRPVVKKVLQPGFVYEGRVVKPAKVIIERENFEPQE